MTSFEELEDAFERGREVGRREGLPFRGVPRVPLVTTDVRFAFERSWIDSFIAYERAVTRQLRAVQQQRWIERQNSLDEARDETLASLQDLIREELLVARDAVDAELATGRGRRCVVQAIRSAPMRPPGVRAFRDVAAFIAEDPRRAIPDWPRTRDAGGADYGAHWRLENPIRRWNTTTWRVSWLNMGDPTYELYAIELLQGGEPAGGRVWLLGRLTESAAVEATVTELERYAQRERNSLVVVAEAVAQAARDED